MPVVQDSDMLQLNSSELYNVWKGQLYIHKPLVCDIELKSSNTCSVPSQLPKKLQIKKVTLLSELRKVLPQSIFEKANFTGQEVCCEGLFYSLYPVTLSNAHGFELGKLLNWLRHEDLALIKILHDHGFLLLVTPSALRCNKDPSQKESFTLYALFLFPHTKLLDKKGRKDSDCSFKNDLSLKITNLLPGLQYAILETHRMQKDKDIKPNALVELHVKHYARLQRKNVDTREIKAEFTDAVGWSPCHKEYIPNKCSQLAFSCLQTYLSAPVNFSVPLMKMSTLLKEDIPKPIDTEVYSKNVIVKEADVLLAASTVKNESSSRKIVLHENLKQPSKNRSLKKSARRVSRKSKRKHVHQTSAEKSENPVLSKKIKLQDDEPEQVVTPSRTTVKLASAPYPHGRKRGAEVLTAEFVNTDKINLKETTVADKRDKQKSTVSTDTICLRKPREKSPVKELFLRPDRPPKRKASETGHRSKLPESTASSEILEKPTTKQKEQVGRISRKAIEAFRSFEPVASFRKHSTDLDLGTRRSPPAPVPENDILEKRINLYESHALNLLADLALNSFCSSSIPYITNESVAPKSEPLVEEKVHEGDSANAVEYPQHDCNLPVQSITASQEPGQASDCTNIPVKNGKDSSPLHTISQQRTESGEKQTSYKVLIAAAKARARNNTTSKISLEHSYSQLPKEEAPDRLSKEVTEESVQKVPETTVASPVAVVVMEQLDPHFPGELDLQPCDNADPTLSKEPRAVSKLQDKFLITFQWDSKYDFDLDSKFTNDPLEKTVNRALHGPWNPQLKEKVEDVKIILHMWLALFYSKPSQPVPSSSRKVVEHSNPAKYVSINTVLDPCFEIVESDDFQLSSPDTEKNSDQMYNEESMHEKVEKSNANNLPIDLSASSSKPKKDYNIKLSSEIFQMYNSSSLSALYSDSLQTTVMCKMMPTSKISTPPTNYMTTSSIPTVCYIGDRKQVNAQLTTKTDKGVDIGGRSSGKVGLRESEHKYSKRFCDVKTQKSSSKEKLNLLFEDRSSDLYGDKDDSESHDLSVSSENVSLTPTRVSSIRGINEEHQATAEIKSPVHAEVSISNALNIDPCSVEPCHPKSEFSRLSDATKEHFPKNKSALFSWMQHEQEETIIQTAKTRIVLKPKIQKINIDLVDKCDSIDHVMKNSSSIMKEPSISIFPPAIKKSNHMESVVGECFPHVANDFESSGLLVNQAQSSEKLLMTYPANGLNGGPLAAEQATKSDGSLSKDRQDTSEDPVPSCTVLQEEIESCISNKLDRSNDTNTLISLELKTKSMNEVRGLLLGKWSEESPEVLADSNEGKEHSAMVKHVVQDTGVSESMSKLELSSSSDETSDVDDADNAHDILQPGEKVHMSKAGTGLVKNMDQKASPDLPNSSVEQPVPVLRADDCSVPEDNVCDMNKGALTVSAVEKSPEVHTMENDITLLHQLKDTEPVNSLRAVENNLCDGEAPCDNEEFGHSPENHDEHTEMCVEEESAVTDSCSNKLADLGENSLFERLTSETMRKHPTIHSSALHDFQSPVYDKDTAHAIKEDASLLEHPVEQTHPFGSPATDTLSNNIKTSNHLETGVPSLEALGVCKEVNLDITLGGELESSKPPEIGHVNTCAEQFPAKSQGDYSSDQTTNLIPDQPEKNSKERAPRIQNAIRKDIFLKLKRICLSSGSVQHTGSNSEDEVYSVHKEPGKCITEELKSNSMIEDLSKPELNTESTNKTKERKTLHREIFLDGNLVQEIPVIASSLTEVEPETLLELNQMTSQSQCLSIAHNDLLDLIGQGQIQDKSSPPPNSENMKQDPVQDKCLSPVNSVLVDKVEQGMVGGKCPVSPTVYLIDDLAQSPVVETSLFPPNVDLYNSEQCPFGEESLVPTNARLIDNTNQDLVEDECLASPSAILTEHIALDSPVGERAIAPPNSTLYDNLKHCLVQDTSLVPSNVASTDNMGPDPVHVKGASPPNGDLVDCMDQDPVQNKCLLAPNVDLIYNIDQDFVQEKIISLPYNGLIDKSGKDPVSQKGFSPPCDDDTSNRDHVQNKPTKTPNSNSNFKKDPAQDKCQSLPQNNFNDGLEPNLVQDECPSPINDEFTDTMEQEDQSEICCIVSTGSISKEQYDRWSETSDEDLGLMQAYQETFSDKTADFQKESHSLLGAQTQQLTFSKPSYPSKTHLLKRHSGLNAPLREIDTYASECLGDRVSPRNHGNISKNGRKVHRESLCAGQPNLDCLFADRMVSKDLTQNTIDMERLRFMCKLKDILKISSTDIHVSDPPFQTMFESKRIPSFPDSRTRCRSPLRITVHCPHRWRGCSSQDSWHPSGSYEPAYYKDEPYDRPTYYSRTPKKVRACRNSPPYHFNRLRYENAVEKASSDISVILKECAQSNHIKLSSVCLGNTAVERTSCLEPQETCWQTGQIFEPSSSKSKTVGNIISDLCTSLHSRLHSVARETAKKNFYFYLFKTGEARDDHDFFSLTKSLLIKDGYTPSEPQNFCDGEQAESNKLFVIIRNEDVLSHIHKIPCLLRLKLHPDVTFTGVNSPEDVTESMYQELFQAGGFVVSSKSLLENITIGKLNEVLMALERMNRTSAWKWLIHYGENRRLKEDKRTESTSHAKIAVLKSYQHSNIIEILPYHQCDSRSKEPSRDLECLLSLQSQRICSRLAVYLTDMPCREAEDFEQNGILVYDVDTFIRRIQKVDVQLQSSSWS